MVTDLLPSEVVPQLLRPANPRPIQPARTAEVFIALAVIAAIALLLGTGFMLGRMQRRRMVRERIRSRRLKKRIDSRNIQSRRPNLRLLRPRGR